MKSDYREKLFRSYSSTHLTRLDREDHWMQKKLSQHTRMNYLKLIEPYDRNTAQVLEIGCSKGFVLSALHAIGFKNLSGTDLSPEDVQSAQKRVPEARIVCEDAQPYLDQRENTFDVILLKAVLEHVPKTRTLSFLEAVHRSLKPGGIAIVDVPNMDWLFAQHERYMDFTHETGFTRESLAQVMGNVFDDVRVIPGAFLPEDSPSGKIIGWIRPAVIGTMNLFFAVLGEGASNTWWHSRSLIGVGRK